MSFNHNQIFNPYARRIARKAEAKIKTVDARRERLEEMKGSRKSGKLADEHSQTGLLVTQSPKNC